ncbi:MAG: hypothetical protein D6742_03560 [Cyanobacteria bacterium J069]|nr:MAG: hypothetical protein D6742_03560 [Cyanobacteria bacterium J069]
MSKAFMLLGAIADYTEDIQSNLCLLYQGADLQTVRSGVIYSINDWLRVKRVGLRRLAACDRVRSLKDLGSYPFHHREKRALIHWMRSCFSKALFYSPLPVVAVSKPAASFAYLAQQTEPVSGTCQQNPPAAPAKSSPPHKSDGDGKSAWGV